MFYAHLNVIKRTRIPRSGGTTSAFGDVPIADLTRNDVEALRVARRADMQGVGCKSGECGINRMMARLRHVFVWAIDRGYIDSTPFKRGGVNVVKLDTSAEAARQRRLQPGEEERLLAVASPHLRSVIVALLVTGCRVGEVLGLRWADLRRDERGEAIQIVLAAARTKTAKPRNVPVGWRLRAELSMRKHAPDGSEHPETAFVFGNETGEQVKDVRRAWQSACEAAGIEDLHVHDLRREFASRLLESSADVHVVRDFLGHSNITTTSRYLASNSAKLARALDHLDPEPPSADSHTVRTPEPSAIVAERAQITVSH